MAGDLLNKYIWLIDLLTRHGRLSRKEINDHWMRASVSDGQPMPERTFFHFRRAIEDTFNIRILCNNFNEYYIEEPDSKRDRAFTNWLVDSYSVTNALREAPEVSDRIMVEEVPSARKFLTSILDAIKDSKKLDFSYAGFNRSRIESGIIFRPYFMKLYKQRWYMVGLKEANQEIRTYALDRIRDLKVTKSTFTPPDNTDPVEFFRNIIGVTTSKADVRTVKLKTTTGQAKYFRALPFHETQKEEVGDGYSIFSYRLKLNYELVHEILALGSEVEVLAPKELVVMVKDELDKMYNFYKNR